MSHPPKVSVVTVFYNRGPYVRASMDSLVSQTLEDIEIIAVDDGSTDDTLNQLKRYESDPRVRVIAKQNSGFTNSMIQAVSASRSAYVAVHDSGDISRRERLAKQAAILDAEMGVGVVSCWVAKQLRPDGPFDVHRPPSGADFHALTLDENPFTHGEVMFRRSVYDQVGGYRPVFTFAQDRDLWVRMSRHCDYRVVPETLYDRLNFPGGVASSPYKRIAQAMLSDFAVQCAHAVDRGEVDPVTLYGMQAPAFRKRSRRLAVRLGRQAYRWALDDLHDESEALLQASFREAITPQGVGALLIAKARDYPMVWNTIQSTSGSVRRKRAEQRQGESA